MNRKSIRPKLQAGLALLAISINSYTQVISTNRNPVGMENNLLFNANQRYTITQSGDAQVDLNMLFDGNFSPSYSGAAVNPVNPTVITISGLPGFHVQAGAWVGWSTRYWPSNRFKIEAYNIWNGNTLGWIIVADYSNSDYSGSDFTVQLPYIAPTSLRFTFYQGIGDGGRFGLSEIYYIQPEATTPYQGLFSSFKNINEVNNNVLIGKTSQTNTSYKLDVSGKIRADEIVVNTNGADFVFEPTYKLRSLTEVETFIKQNKHLPDISSSSNMQTNGVSMGEMQAKLLQKVEELTLYIIKQDNDIKDLKKIINQLKNKN